MSVLAFAGAIIFLSSCNGGLRKTRSGDDYENPRIGYLRRAMEKQHRILCGDERCLSAADRVCVDALGEFGEPTDVERWDGHQWSGYPDDEVIFNCADSPGKREAAERRAWKRERAGVRIYEGPLDDANEVAQAMLDACQEDERQSEQEVATVQRHGERRFSCDYERYPFEPSPKGIAPCRHNAQPPESCLAEPMVLDCTSTVDCTQRAREWCRKSSSELYQQWTVDLSSIEEFVRSFEGIEYIHDVQFQCKKEAAPPGYRYHAERSEEFEHPPSTDAPSAPSDTDDFDQPSGVVACQLEMPSDHTYVGRNPNSGKGDADITQPEPIGSSLRPKDGKGIDIGWTYDARSEGSRSDDIVTVHVHNTTSDHHMKFRFDLRTSGADGRLLHRQEKVEFDLRPGEQESARVLIPHPNGKAAGDDVATIVLAFVKLSCYIPPYQGPALNPFPLPPTIIGPGVN